MPGPARSRYLRGSPGGPGGRFQGQPHDGLQQKMLVVALLYDLFAITYVQVQEEHATRAQDCGGHWVDYIGALTSVSFPSANGANLI